MEALIAALAVVKLLTGKHFDRADFQNLLIRNIFRPAVRADSPKKPLRNNAAKTCRNQVRLYSHVLQAVDCRHGILRMNGCNHQMTGNCRTHCDLRGLAVTDFSDADDVRILTQNSTEAARKGESYLLIDLNLRRARNVVLHRVLQSHQIRAFIQHLANQGEHRRCFTGAGRSHYHDDAACVRKEAVHLSIILRKNHADSLSGQHLLVLAEDTDYDFFAENRRQRVDTHVHIPPLDLHIDTAVLRNPSLYDVHVRHNLDTGDDGVLEICRYRQNLMQPPVNSHADLHVAFGRLNMNIRAGFHHGALDDGVHKTDGRSLFCRILLALHHRILANSGLGAHRRHGLRSIHVFVQNVDRMLYRSAACDHRNDIFPARIPRSFDRHEVQRIRHRNEQIVTNHLNRNDLIFLRKRLRNVARHGRIDRCFRQINEINAELISQCINQLLLRDVAVFNQHRAQTLVCLLLLCQCLFQLFLRQQSI